MTEVCLQAMDIVWAIVGFFLIGMMVGHTFLPARIDEKKERRLLDLQFENYLLRQKLSEAPKK